MTLAYVRAVSLAERAWLAARWLPALAAAAYVATAAAMGARIARLLGWDTDVSGPLVLAETLRGSGTVYLPHISTWTALWFELATRDLPGHRQLWEASGYVFAVLGAILVGWATGRVATRWAGVTAFAVTLIVGPQALRSLFTLGFHVTTPFTAALLAAFLVLLPHRPARLLAVPVGVLAGVNAASDPLLWLAGIVPFACAAAVLVAATRRRDVGTSAGLTVIVAVGAAIGANTLMHSLGYREIGAGRDLASLGDLPGHVLLLGRMVALLGGANYALPGPYPVEPLRVLVALLVLLGVATPLLAAAKYARRRTEPLRLAYACYWAAVVMLLGVAFVVTTNAASLGAGSFNYLLTFAPAAGAGVGLLTLSHARAGLLVAAGAAVVGATNIAGVLQGRAETSPGLIGTYEKPLVEMLTEKGVTRGYAGYWDAQNLTWQSGTKLFVAPVTRCEVPGRPLCQLRFFVIDSWYDERPGPSFLIVDPTTPFLPTAPPLVRRASASYRFGRLRVYVFPYDLARNMGISMWGRSLR
jgi:hypothetical protein